MRYSLHICLTLLFVMLLSGCASTYDLTSTRFTTSGEPPKKILVAMIATDDRLNMRPGYFASFNQNIKSDLVTCSVESDTITIPMPALLELSLGNPVKSAHDNIQKRVDTYGPDYILQINDDRPIGTGVTASAELTQLPGHNRVWRTDIKKNGWNFGFKISDTGKDLADELVTQMHVDGVLAGCPAAQ